MARKAVIAHDKMQPGMTLHGLEGPDQATPLVSALGCSRWSWIEARLVGPLETFTADSSRAARLAHSGILEDLTPSLRGDPSTAEHRSNRGREIS